jgi:hypothetical protein
MTRTAIWLVGLAALAAPGGAQDGARSSPDPNAVLAELQREQRQVIKDWQAKVKEARADAEAAKAAGKPLPAIPMRPDMSALRQKHLDAAKQFAGEDAVRFLLPALNMGETAEQRREVLDLLLQDHIASPKLRELGPMLGYLDQIVDAEYAAKARARIAEHATDPALLGWLAKAEHEKTLREEAPASAAFQDAKAALLAAVAKASDKSLERSVKTLLAEQEKFGRGMQAPDIAGVDLDGVAFKLSDYKGKVIFLDFWGDW